MSDPPAQKYCTACGVSIQENARFCPKCGAGQFDVQHAPAKRETAQISSKRGDPKPPKKPAPLWFRISLGLLGFVFIAGVIGSLSSGSNPTAAVAPTPSAEADSGGPIGDDAAKLLLTPMLGLKDPDSARFSDTFRHKHHGATAYCGFVNAKNGFGAYNGPKAFIITDLGVMTQENTGNARFHREWQASCVEADTPADRGKAPNGALRHAFGSAPTSDLKPDGKSADGLQQFVPKAPPTPFMGIPVKEESFSYDRRRMFLALVVVTGEANRDAMLAALIKAYGKPDTADDDARTYKWKWPAITVVLGMSYNAKTGDTVVTVSKGKLGENYAALAAAK